ncbi:MAG: HAD family hydrolase [Chloroflexaceae bacterium]|nr:HAD family hydrolase [Chloroflexaceae bacterium]
MNLTQLLSETQAVLFDMDGVLYRGNTPLPGVSDVIAFCDANEIAYACVTNNSTRTPRQFETRMATMGIHIPESHILTSSQVASRYLRANYPKGTTVYAMGMSGLQQVLFGDGYFVACDHKPQLVVQGADMALTYDKLRLGCLAVRAGARFIATNPDRTFPTEEGLQPGAGALLAIVQAATGVVPFVVGKPETTMFHVALNLLQAKRESTLMVGDRLETDIRGARQAGLRSLLVLTGVTSAEEAASSADQPDAVVNDLAELLAVWQTLQ